MRKGIRLFDVTDAVSFLVAERRFACSEPSLLADNRMAAPAIGTSPTTVCSIIPGRYDPSERRCQRVLHRQALQDDLIAVQAVERIEKCQSRIAQHSRNPRFQTAANFVDRVDAYSPVCIPHPRPGKQCANKRSHPADLERRRMSPGSQSAAMQ